MYLHAIFTRSEEVKEELVTSLDMDFIKLRQGYIRALRDILDIELEATE